MRRDFCRRRFTSSDAIYRRLHSASGSDGYLLANTLVGLGQTADTVELRFASGEVVGCALAIGAEGRQSTVRPASHGSIRRYAGYISWRWVVRQPNVSTETWRLFGRVFTYGLLEDSHIIAYPVPVIADDRVVEQQINFQCYWNVEEAPNSASSSPATTGNADPFGGVRAAAEAAPGPVVGAARAERELSPPFAELVTSAQ